MKKLTTIFILLFIGAAVFAEPKFPKYSITDENAVPYLYISNDCQSIYEIKATVYPNSKKAVLGFCKKSLVLPTKINIAIEFSTEKKLDDFIKDIDLSDIEDSFVKVRQRIIKQGITPDIILYDKSETAKLIKETKTIYGYGYDEHFDWKTLPSTCNYRVSY